jgi:hypothetical protein
MLLTLYVRLLPRCLLPDGQFEFVRAAEELDILSVSSQTRYHLSSCRVAPQHLRVPVTLCDGHGVLVVSADGAKATNSQLMRIMVLGASNWRRQPQLSGWCSTWRDGNLRRGRNHRD